MFCEFMYLTWEKLTLLHCVTRKKRKCVSRKQFTSNLVRLFSVLNFCVFS